MIPPVPQQGYGQRVALIPRKHVTIKSEPVLFFDNTSSGSRPLELLTVTETAEFLNISKSGVRRLQHGRHLPFIKVGGSVRFAKSDLVVYVEKRRVEPID